MKNQILKYLLGPLHIPAKRPGFETDPSVLRPPHPWGTYEASIGYESQYNPNWFLDRDRKPVYYGGYPDAHAQFTQVIKKQSKMFKFKLMKTAHSSRPDANIWNPIDTRHSQKHKNTQLIVIASVLFLLLEFHFSLKAAILELSWSAIVFNHRRTAHCPSVGWRWISVQLRNWIYVDRSALVRQRIIFGDW